MSDGVASSGAKTDAEAASNDDAFAALARWTVWVQRDGHEWTVGEVRADSEEWARCAAEVRYGVTERELADGAMPDPRVTIFPGDRFVVRRVALSVDE